MRNLLILALLFVSINYSNAQFGFAAKYNSNSYSKWNDFNEQVFNSSDGLFSSDLEFSANYLLRLKETRIEFLPELSYHLSSSEDLTIAQNFNATNSFSKIGFNINTHIYFMDLANDCDCPTFSKDGGSLQKAIHLILSPGLVYSNNEVEVASDAVSYSASGVGFKLGAGLGFDIGINDLVTMTPFFTVNYSSSFSGDAFRDLILNYLPVSSFAPENSSNFYSQFGIRIGLRPDYLKGR